ncbi:MAG TPA: cyclic nucleotide-gated ion channel [Bauldia sp.]|nr:cyclic nucleotide-gated ion channel [Bauldia sp.]
MSARPISLRRRVYEIVERVDEKSGLSRLFATSLVLLIVINVAGAVFDSMPDMGPGERAAFRVIETISLVVFAVEYVVRAWASVEHPRARRLNPWIARLEYLVTPSAIIDLLALAPFVASLLFGLDLEVILLLRLLRLFKLARYSTGFQSLFEAVRRERHALFACVLILISVVLVFAALMYTTEHSYQPQVFASIPAAMWWAIATVTTVGYGDVVPITTLGRVIAGLTMMSGIAMIALPVAIISSSFAEVVRQKGFVITSAMIERVALFSVLEREDIESLLPLFRAVTVGPGATITGEWTDHHALYVVVDGRVELSRPDGARELGSGDAFGGLPSLNLTEPGHPTYALTTVRLLVLESIDFVRLVERHPGIGERLVPKLRARVIA